MIRQAHRAVRASLTRLVNDREAVAATMRSFLVPTASAQRAPIWTLLFTVIVLYIFAFMAGAFLPASASVMRRLRSTFTSPRHRLWCVCCALCTFAVAALRLVAFGTGSSVQ